MFRKVFLAASALALLGCVRAQEPAPVTVSNVEVAVDLPAIATRSAAHHWATLEDDLSGALAQEFVGMTSPTGYVVRVDVDELSLAALASQRLGADEARLVGRVEMIDPRTEAPARSFAVGATANQAAVFLPEGANAVAVSPSSHEFYAAVIRAFARGVAEAVRSGPTPPA